MTFSRNLLFGYQKKNTHLCPYATSVCVTQGHPLLTKAEAGAVWGSGHQRATSAACGGVSRPTDEDFPSIFFFFGEGEFPG